MTDFQPTIYQDIPQLVLGFHGCDKEVGLSILNSPENHLSPSTNNYDWLGSGIYFWLNDPQRAYEWAVQSSKRNPGRIKQPFVIGAIIDLGRCLNLCERDAIMLLQSSYDVLKKSLNAQGLDISKQYVNRAPDPGGFKLLRRLDCAVINNAHRMVEEYGQSFDTVYGYFQQGADAFDGSGIRQKSHIQICVRNTDCIKGYFLPRLK